VRPAARRRRRRGPGRTFGRDVALGAVLLVASRPSSWRRPLNRDLAQYLYAGTIVRHGGTPYRDVALNKGPAVFLIFAGVGKLTGTHSVRVRIVMTPAAIASVAALRGLLGCLAPAAAPAGSLVFALLCSARSFEGDEPNTEVQGTAPALAACWAAARGSGAASGIALAGAMLINPSFAYTAPALLLCLPRTGRRGSAAAFAAALSGVLIAAAALLARRGALADAATQVLTPARVNTGVGWRENFRYGRAGDADFLTDVPGWPLWATALTGSAIGHTAPRTRRASRVAAAWVVGVWLRVKIDGYSYPHHFYPALPGLAAGIALGADAVAGRVARPVGWLAAVVAAPLFAGLVAAPQLRALRAVPWQRPGVRVNDGLAYAAAAYLADHSVSEDRIFVPGSEPAVLWLADRRAPSRLFDIYPLIHHEPYVAERERSVIEHPPQWVCAMPDTPSEDPQLDLLMRSHPYDAAWSSHGAVIYRLANPQMQSDRPTARDIPDAELPRQQVPQIDPGPGR
jgi:hypothetical protein